MAPVERIPTVFWMYSAGNGPVLDAAIKARYSTQIAMVYRNDDAEAMVIRRLVGLFAAAVVNAEQSKLIGAKSDRLPNVCPGLSWCSGSRM